jgi:hypothetical protein
VSKKASAAGGVEAKRRDARERSVIPLDDVFAWIGDQLGA